nr:hypothetical protein HmN_000043100 [Hymenolepis microstoma]
MAMEVPCKFSLGSDSPLQPIQDPSSDIVNLHSNLFSERRNFCPRTLKSSASSRIRDLPCYNPPKPNFSDECEFGKAELIPYELNGTKKFAGSTQLKSGSRSGKKLSKKVNSIRHDVGHYPHKSGDDLNVLRFTSEITNEIIREKQFSNSQLMDVFHYHLDRSDITICREDRMKSIQQIAKQLNVPSKLIEELSSSNRQCQAINDIKRIDEDQRRELNPISTGRKCAENEIGSMEKSKSYHRSLTDRSDIKSETEKRIEPLNPTFSFSKRKSTPSQSSSTTSSSQESDCIIEEVGKLLGSIKVGKGDEKAKQEDYEDDFEDTTDSDESNKIKEEISSFENDYSTETFEDDDE